MPAELTLRPATVDDLPDVAEVYLRARRAAIPAMPPPAHDPGSIRSWVAGWDLSQLTVWIAVTDRIVGFVALTETWLESLYVDPSAQRNGVGAALLDVARAQRPGGFGLWVFESNEPARDFYHEHGLVELEHTDGSENEERRPDIRMAWPGEEPLVFLRQQIDEVDRHLAELLSRRVALTAAVQVRKPRGGHEGRDRQREREIAEQMARHAPAFGADRLARIMDAVITESLDVAAGP